MFKPERLRRRWVDSLTVLALLGLNVLSWFGWLILISLLIVSSVMARVAASGVVFATLLFTISTGVPWLVTFYSALRWQEIRDEVIEPAVTEVYRLMKLSLRRWARESVIFSSLHS